MKRFPLICVEVAAWFVGAVILSTLLASASLALAALLSVLLGVVALVILIFRGRPKSGRQPIMPNRWRALGVLWAACVLFISYANELDAWQEAELTAAREAGDDAYLQRVRELRGDDAWMEALRELNPRRYAEEQERLATLERQREAEDRERRRQLFYDPDWREREQQRICDHVDRWLLYGGTRQYQRDARPGVQVLSVSGINCTAQFREDGLVDVQVADITVALADRPNPGDMIADALVRPDRPETLQESERAICRMAWGPYDWFELEGC